MVVLEDLLGLDQVDRLGLGLAPRNRQHPVEIVAHHGALGRHRAHIAQLLQLALGLGPRLLGELGLLDLLFEFEQFVARVVGLAKLALDRLHLLIQIVLALGLLHLALDPAAYLLLDLQHADLALHQGVDALQPLDHIGGLQELLTVDDLDREVRGDAVGQLARVGDLRQRGQGLGLHLLVQFDVILELIDHGARQGLGLVFRPAGFRHVGDLGLIEFGLFGVAQDGGAPQALDQHLDGAIRQLQQLQHGGDDADLIDGVGGGIVLVFLLLGDEQDRLVAAHRLFERAHGLVAADEQRRDHVGIDHDVAQRQDGQDVDLGLWPRWGPRLGLGL